MESDYMNNILVEIIMVMLFFMVLILYLNERSTSKKITYKIQDELDKFKEYYFLLIQWGHDYQVSARLSNFLYRNNYKVIAIYGASDIGELLYCQMKKEGIEVQYYIDRRSDVLTSEIAIYSLEDELPDVDVVVITAIHYYDEIRKALEEKNIKSVSLRDVVCGV